MNDKINYALRAGRSVQHSITLTIDGKEETRTFAEWSRHPDCVVAKDTIRSRAQAGNCSPRDCVFMPHQQPNRRTIERKPSEPIVDLGMVRKASTMRWV